LPLSEAWALHISGSYWLYKKYPCAQVVVMSIRPHHSLQTVQKTISDQNRFCYDSRQGSRANA